MNSEKSDIHSIPIKYIKSKKARNIRITMKPVDGVIVTVPFGNSFAQAERFVNSKIDWITKQQNKVKKAMEGFTIFDETSQFFTREHKLVFIPLLNDDKMKIKVTANEIKVFYPSSTDFQEQKIQEFIRKGIEEAWRMEAKKDLPERVEKWAKQFGFFFRNVKIRNAVTRWGSCTHNNDINLSLHLMRLPDYLIDYVILHELAHTVHKNHKKNFRKMLEKICLETKVYEKEIRRYSTHIY